MAVRYATSLHPCFWEKKGLYHTVNFKFLLLSCTGRACHYQKTIKQAASLCCTGYFIGVKYTCERAVGIVSSSGSDAFTSSNRSAELWLSLHCLHSSLLLSHWLVLDVCVSKLNLSGIKVLLSSISSAIFSVCFHIISLKIKNFFIHC